MADRPENDHAKAVRHVAEGRRIVARQRERIARLKAAGCSTFDAEQTLAVFLRTFEIFEDHERELGGGYTIKKMQSILCMFTQDIVKMYELNVPRPGLRVVS